MSLLDRIDRAARAYLRGDLSQRVTRATAEREAFDEEVAGDFLSGADLLNAYEAENDVCPGDAAHRCPKCPHWVHTGNPCAACPCVSIYLGDSTFETGAELRPETSASTPGAVGSSTAGTIPPIPAVEHTTTDLLYAAANQLDLWEGGARMTAARSRYLNEMIPELRARAAQLEDTPDCLGSQREQPRGDVPNVPSPGQPAQM